MNTENVSTSNQGYSLSSNELSKLTEFFALLIKIDKKSKKKGKHYANQSIRQNGKS